MEISRSNQSAPPVLNSQKGFAMVLALSLLPLLLAAGFAFLFSGHLLKNWMQSLHICRTELLKTQSQAKSSLDRLLALNKLATSLRAQLLAARIQRAAAIAAQNYPLAAQALARIFAIQAQQRTLDLAQKKLILMANFQMSSGLRRVISRLHTQDANNLTRSTALFEFRIDSIRTFPKTLAVHPDSPDVAPVYELNNDFSQSQGLSVSWNSRFKTNSVRGSRWIQNQHAKKDHCAVSLKRENGSFKEILIEDKQ